MQLVVKMGAIDFAGPHGVLQPRRCKGDSVHDEPSIGRSFVIPSLTDLPHHAPLEFGPTRQAGAPKGHQRASTSKHLMPTACVCIPLEATLGHHNALQKVQRQVRKNAKMESDEA
jgi:hypothetical protein